MPSAGGGVHPIAYAPHDAKAALYLALLRASTISKGLLALGRPQEAVTSAQLSVDYLRVVTARGGPWELPAWIQFGDKRLFLASALYMLAKGRVAIDQYPASVIAYRESLQRQEHVAMSDLGAAWQGIAGTYDDLADVQAQHGDLDAAQASREDGLATYARALRGLHPPPDELLSLYSFAYLKKFEATAGSAPQCDLLLKAWDVGQVVYRSPVEMYAKKAVKSGQCPQGPLRLILTAPD